MILPSSSSFILPFNTTPLWSRRVSSVLCGSSLLCSSPICRPVAHMSSHLSHFCVSWRYRERGHTWLFSVLWVFLTPDWDLSKSAVPRKKGKKENWRNVQWIHQNSLFYSGYGRKATGQNLVIQQKAHVSLECPAVVLNIFSVLSEFNEQSNTQSDIYAIICSAKGSWWFSYNHEYIWPSPLFARLCIHPPPAVEVGVWWLKGHRSALVIGRLLVWIPRARPPNNTACIVVLCW